MKHYHIYILAALALAWPLANSAQIMRCGVSESYDHKASPPVATPRETVTIPVVFHIVYHSPSENISRSRIQDQLDVLNEDYNKENLDIARVPRRWERRIGNANIRFCLADVDPFGNEHSGIIRRRTNIDSIGGKYNPEGVSKLLKYDNLGGSSAWDTERYLNVWVSNRMDEVLGIATFPNDENIPDNEQGVEIYYRAITGDPEEDYDYSLGRTLTHEIGHYLGLQHLWGSELTCIGSGDDIGDTPKQGKAYFGCPLHPQSSCGSVDMTSNFMNFSNDECLNFFTEGQVERMREVLFSHRFELISGGLCDAEIPTPPDPLALSEISQQPFGVVIRLSRVPRIGYVLRLYDAAGRLVWTEKQNYLSVHLVETEQLSSGIYFIQLTAPNVKVARKIAIIK